MSEVTLRALWRWEGQTTMLLLAMLAACGPTTPNVSLPFDDWSHAHAATTIVIAQPAKLALTASKTASPSQAYEGSATVRISVPDTYDVAISSGAWIDMTSGGIPVSSVAHRHGADCTPIKKIVTFNLKSGHYALKISKSSEASVVVEIVAHQTETVAR